MFFTLAALFLVRPLPFPFNQTNQNKVNISFVLPLPRSCSLPLLPLKPNKPPFVTGMMTITSECSPINTCKKMYVLKFSVTYCFENSCLQ